MEIPMSNGQRMANGFWSKEVNTRTKIPLDVTILDAKGLIHGEVLCYEDHHHSMVLLTVKCM